MTFNTKILHEHTGPISVFCLKMKLSIQSYQIVIMTLTWVGGWHFPHSNLLPSQGLIQAVFNTGIPILGTLIWVCPNLILVKLKLQLNTIPVFWSNQQHNLNIITKKYKINVMYSLFELLNDNIGTQLQSCCNFVG